MRIKGWLIATAAAVLVIGIISAVFYREPLRYWVWVKALGNTRTVEQVLKQYGRQAEIRFRQPCESAGIGYPPARVYLLAFKTEKQLEVWAANKTGKYRFLTTYSILAASGTTGPKRRVGDRQVPEGFYRLTDLNPNSRYHLSFKIDYPNEEDVRRESVPRERLGGDIFIHGNQVSIGCLAIGNENIEELFCLIAQVPQSSRRILISPIDYRRNPDWKPQGVSREIENLYERIRAKLNHFPIGGGK